MAQLVNVVNRTQETLEGTWNGRPYVFPPGDVQKHPKIIARKFREQNPVMGSEDPRTGSIVFKLGVQEDGDPITPLTPEMIARFSGSVERWDRDKLLGARPSEVVPGDNGMYNANMWRSAQPLATTGDFTKPE